jgi:large subunit ribosomal protein L30
MAQTSKIKLTLVKGVCRTKQSHKDTVRGLGLKWTQHTVEVIDTPATRGMINKVGYLLKVVEPAAK